jgi:hypothetical protein
MNQGQRAALLSVDPRLSRFDPLERIVFYDDFSQGLSGWCELMRNYPPKANSVFDIHRALRDYRPPMLSSATMPDMGTHGAMQGTYALKIASRPRAGHFSKSLKRITWVRRTQYQVECFFTFKPEPVSVDLGDKNVRAFGVSFDLHDDDHRYHLCLRYLNAYQGELQQKWQYMARGFIIPDVEGWPDDTFDDVPSGAQRLCYNETPTKLNWHYLRWLVDLGERRHIELQCNDHTFDLRECKPELHPADPNLWCLLNVGFWVEADTDVRSFFFADSVLLSTRR